MIGTHKEWMLLREVRNRLNAFSFYSESDEELCKRFTELYRCFEISEQSFLNQNEETNLGT